MGISKPEGYTAGPSYIKVGGRLSGPRDAEELFPSFLIPPEVLRVSFRKPLFQLLLRRRVRRLVSEVSPLVRVAGHVVKHLCTITIADVVVTGGANSMVGSVPPGGVSDDSRVRPGNLGILHQLDQAASIKVFACRQTAELHQGGVQVDQADRAFAALR